MRSLRRDRNYILFLIFYFPYPNYTYNLRTGVHHSEHGIIAFAINPDTGKYDPELSEEVIKQYVKENFGE
jgi:hypothetical protein